MKVWAHDWQSGPYIRRSTAIGEYTGPDVSLKETAVSIRRGGKRVWRGKCLSNPAVVAGLIRKHAPSAEWVVYETGSLWVWFHHVFTAEGLPEHCHTNEAGYDDEADIARELVRLVPENRLA